MNKYRNISIVLTSIVAVGMTPISLAQSNQLKNNHKNLEEITTPDISSFPDIDEQISVKGITTYKKDLGKENSVLQIQPKEQSPNSPGSSQNEVATFVEPQIDNFLPQALAIIQEFEGFREQAYVDTDGTAVIGYGLSKVDGRKVRLGDRISVTKADAALKKEVLVLEEQIKSMVKVELNSNQLSALTSFAYNVGIYGLQSSTLLKKLNTGDYAGAANEFLRWNKAHIRGRKVALAGLTRRREAEKQLFLK